MPAGDGTGPMGRGPMTGRGAGYCAGSDMPGYANPYAPRMGLGWRRGWGRGRGMGRGGGWGRGWRSQYYAAGPPGYGYPYPPAWGAPPDAPYAAPPTREQEVGMLREQAEWLKEQLEAISRRIAEFEQEK